jgi:GNAT superfamily N-acetyltransferase
VPEPLLSEISPAIKAPRLSIENFRGDFKQLASLMQASWAENSAQTLLYSSEFLASCFEYPGADFSMAPAIYVESKLVGFVAGFPRHVKFNDRIQKIIVITFLTVLPEYKKKGLGIMLWSELVNRARAAGFDGMVNYCVDGEPMNAMIEGSCKRLKLPVARIYSTRYMSIVLRSGDNRDGSDLKANNQQAADVLLDLAAPLAASQPFARLWSKPEAEWQCARRSEPIVETFSAGDRSGLLTGYIMPISDKQHTRCLLIEDIIWGTLTPEERQTLLQKFLNKAASAGVRLATVPVLGYADMEPFKKARFQSTRRVLHAYLTLWSPGHAALPSEPLSSMYLDIF